MPPPPYIQRVLDTLAHADALAEAVDDLLDEIAQMHAVEMGPDGPDNCAAVCLKVAFVKMPLQAYRAARQP